MEVESVFWDPEKVSFSLNRLQLEVKSVATFSVILVTLATPPLPPQTKLNLEQMGGMTAFLDTTLAGGGGVGG